MLEIDWKLKNDLEITAYLWQSNVRCRFNFHCYKGCFTIVHLPEMSMRFNQARACSAVGPPENEYEHQPKPAFFHRHPYRAGDV
ncbi:hypothetical protein LJC47_01600 [Desulfosarcina sp. OttesenSCG-928-B08]|nr:hypothetical protein [Desulfosarcina sp. OttesenSCG-928-B08]